MRIPEIGMGHKAGNCHSYQPPSNADLKIQALKRDLQALNTEKQRAVQRNDQKQIKELERRIQELEKQIRELQREKEDHTESMSANEQVNREANIPSSDGLYVDELV